MRFDLTNHKCIKVFKQFISVGREIIMDQNPKQSSSNFYSVIAFMLLIAFTPVGIATYTNYTGAPPKARAEKSSSIATTPKPVTEKPVSHPPAHPAEINPRTESRPYQQSSTATQQTHTRKQSYTQQETKMIPDVSYIGNRRTHKFHRSSCGSVRQMNEGNMVEFENRSDALDAGYIPCKRCYP